MIRFGFPFRFEPLGMQKLLTYWVLGASLLLTGCSWLGDLPFVYKMDVQQGNVIDQEMVNKLEPGMNKNQVRYVLGTPMLVDVFHQERWDYVYTMQKRGKPLPGHRLSVYFEDNRLVRVQGDLRPQASSDAPPPRTETVVSVPDYTGKETGLINRALRSVGIGED